MQCTMQHCLDPHHLKKILLLLLFENTTLRKASFYEILLRSTTFRHKYNYIGNYLKLSAENQLEMPLPQNTFKTSKHDTQTTEPVFKKFVSNRNVKQEKSHTCLFQLSLLEPQSVSGLLSQTGLLLFLSFIRFNKTKIGAIRSTEKTNGL